MTNRLRKGKTITMQQALDELRASVQSQIDASGTSLEPEQCDVCNGAGWVLPYAGAAMSSASVCPLLCDAAKQFIEYRRAARFRRAGIPTRYQALTFATFEALGFDQKLNKWLAYAAMREFADKDNGFRVSRHRLAERLKAQFGAATPARVLQWLADTDVIKRGVALQGEAGVGKTGLAIAGMNAMLDLGIDVRYMRVYDVIVLLRETWQQGSERDVLQEFQECPVLVLDEFNLIDASAVAKPHQAEYMTSIMRYREAAGLPTLITCNINKEQFYHQWGVQCADVVMVACHWIAVGGMKLRQTDDDMGDAI
jgi:DNA replication protein DnaC